MALSYEKRHLPFNTAAHKRAGGGSDGGAIEDALLLEDDPGDGSSVLLLEDDPGDGSSGLLLEDAP